MSRSLERSLHPHMPLGADIVGGHEYFLDPVRDTLYPSDAALPGEFFHQFRGVEPFFLGYFSEVGVHLHQLIAVQYVTLVAQREQRLYPAGAVGDYAQGARRGNGGYGGIPHPVATKDLMIAIFKGWEYPSFLRQLFRCFGRFFVDEPHDFLGHLQRLLRIVTDLKLYQHICEAHHSQAYLAGFLGHLLYLGEGEPVLVDYIVQKPYGDPYRAL